MIHITRNTGNRSILFHDFHLLLSHATGVKYYSILRLFTGLANAALHIEVSQYSKLYRIRTLPVSKTNLFVYRPLLVRFKSPLFCSGMCLDAVFCCSLISARGLTRSFLSMARIKNKKSCSRTI